MTYKGIVRGKVIELEGKVVLPEGTEVEMVVKERQGEELAPRGYAKGSPKAILAAFDIPPRCAPGDVDALLQAIEQGKRPGSRPSPQLTERWFARSRAAKGSTGWRGCPKGSDGAILKLRPYISLLSWPVWQCPKPLETSTPTSNGKLSAKGHPWMRTTSGSPQRLSL